MGNLFNIFVDRIKEAIANDGRCEINVCYGTSSVECRSGINVTNYCIYEDGTLVLYGSLSSMIAIDPDETEIRYDEYEDCYTIASDGQEFEIQIYN